MFKKDFMKNMENLYTRLRRKRISQSHFLYLIKKIEKIYEKSDENTFNVSNLDDLLDDILAVLPTEVGWRVIEEELSRMELKDIEKFPLFNCSLISGYHLETDTPLGLEGPKIKIFIVSGKKFTVKLFMYDSEEYPRGKYSAESEPVYIDWDQIHKESEGRSLAPEEERQLINKHTYGDYYCKPVLLYKSEIEVERQEEIWSWIGQQLDKCKKVWKALVKSNPEGTLPSAYLKKKGKI